MSVNVESFPATDTQKGAGRCLVKELPEIIQLKDNLYCASFPLMKLLPARYILDEAERTGQLTPGAAIVESTSGTFGLALALLCAERGYKLILVGDSAIDKYLMARLKVLGARVVLIDKGIEEREGPQKARLDTVNEIIKSENAYWTQQYFNEGNIASYRAVSEHIHNNIGQVDFLCGTVGTGGSMSGTSIGLRSFNPAMKTIGIDTHNSVLFGHKNGKRQLRGLGNSIIPGNIRYEEFDDIHWVSAGEAYLASREIYRTHGLFMGGTSGAAYLVANWYANHHPDKKVITLFPDEGHRYFDTIYDDEWINTLPGWGTKQFSALAPVYVNRPDEELTRWSMFRWNRRAYK
ncbi:PLP-dependent cysteine synthase family protein [Enterobacter cloacae]|uniref:PLP-dependent cysteine synthase family protein n=1 Tax=Enterobacter cloacae TaxID=550 RepID=UPI001AC372E0|nr:cysteine synthase family protein [Enterobacter cloacae]MCU6414155.1 cysteine synthase family protein [Enterobacter cloacae]HAZ4815791.1 cysteine synthase family protein [Enterobacter cloacae]